MMKIYIDAAHCPASPGACIYGRTEYGDNLRLASALYKKLSRIKGMKVFFEAEKKISDSGVIKKAISSGAGRIIIFHRGWADETGPRSGSRIFLPPGAGSGVIYEGELLLDALCRASGLKNRGVHPVTDKTLHKSLFSCPADGVFLIEAGFADNIYDNIKFDACFEYMAQSLAEIIAAGMKEGDIYENYTAV